MVVALGGGYWLYAAAMQSYGPYGVVRRVACMSNLKKVAQATLVYAQDYDDRLMPSGQWMDALSTSPGSKPARLESEDRLRCPCLIALKGNLVYGYAYNSDLSHEKLSSFELPEHTALAYESNESRRNASDPLTSFSGPFDPAIRSSARANVAYLSGHVERSIKEEK